MIAFTRDFHVLASRVLTGISAVHLARGNLAKTRYVRTFRRLLIDHLNSPLTNRCSKMAASNDRHLVLHLH